MSACDVVAKTDYYVRRTNPLEAIAEKVEGLVADLIHDKEQRVADLREAIKALYALRKKPIEPFHVYLDLPERLLWNWALDQLDDALAKLDGELTELEGAAQEFADIVGSVLEGLGNPATLNDVAGLLRSGVSDMATELATQVTLAKLSVDNEWESEAAERYTERAQLQATEGLDELARHAILLADALEGHCETELDFWEGAAGLIVEIVLFVVGLFFTLLGLAGTIAGLVLAAPTAGAGLVITVLGVVSCAGGIILTAVSGFLLVKSIYDLIDDAEASLSSSVADMNSNTIPGGQTWPILAR